MSSNGQAMTSTYKLSIAKQFTDTPGARYYKDGDHSGQEFREEKLKPLFEKALKEGAKIEIDLDDTEGYATSFLEEAFGGLAREYNNTEKVNSMLIFKTLDEPGLENEVRKYIKDALKGNRVTK